MLHRGYLIFRGENQIYFIKCVEHIRIFTSADVCNSQDEIYLVFTEKK